jgi:integral membrane protein
VERYFVSELNFLRIASLAEGVSYLVLLFVAMPLKYLAHDPSWVSWVGRLHGALFVLLVFALARTASALAWNARKVGGVMLAAIVPFGAFPLERRLAAEARAAEPS